MSTKVKQAFVSTYASFIIFQFLSKATSFEGDHVRYCPDNADHVRAILERSGKVIGVFQGHYHDGDIM